MKDVFVARIKVPPRKQAPDRIVDAVAEIWNEADRDNTAYNYLQALADGRSEMLYESLFRYRDERDRRLLAKELLRLADAIYGAVGPWL